MFDFVLTDLRLFCFRNPGRAEGRKQNIGKKDREENKKKKKKVSND